MAIRQVGSPLVKGFQLAYRPNHSKETALLRQKKGETQHVFGNKLASFAVLLDLSEAL